jgi:hypothetical protein
MGKDAVQPRRLLGRRWWQGGGGSASRLEVLNKPDNRIFLGCAAVSGNGSWMEGAVAAAWHTVAALHPGNDKLARSGSAESIW